MAVRLAAVEHGEGPPLAILHGAFGSGRNWGTIAQRLAAAHRVILLDLRNHGASPWADTMGYAEMAEDVRQTMLALGHRRFALLGHSMGGKVAMVAALLHRDSIERLIVADIAPVAYQARHLDEVRAMRALDLTSVRRRAQADAMLAATLPDTAERGFLLQNLVFDGERARWRLNLAAIEREMPSLVGFPALSASAYEGPALFVAGERSDYVLPQYEERVLEFFPEARVERVANAGHWLHAERPQPFLDVVEPFLGA